MKTSARIAASVSAFVLVGGIAAGSLAVADALTPEPTKTVLPVSYERPAGLFADTATTSPSSIQAEAERQAAEAAAAAEAQRLADEAAAAQAEADRLAAEQAAAEAEAEVDTPVGGGSVNVGGGGNSNPAPAPAPAPEVPTQPGGDQQAGECREYNENNECTAVYVP